MDERVKELFMFTNSLTNWHVRTAYSTGFPSKLENDGAGRRKPPAGARPPRRHSRRQAGIQRNKAGK